MTHSANIGRVAAMSGGVLLVVALATAQSASQTFPPAPVGAQPFLAARAQLDQTVWSPEVLAQHYEQRFVQLWDELLQGDDHYNALGSFPFSTLSFGGLTGRESLDLGIQRTTYSGASHNLSPDDWRAVLDQFQSEGYEIEQTEWHHSSFEPPEAGRAAHSEVSAVIHAVRENPPHRVIVQATLAVTWSPRVDAQDVPIPGDIEVANLEILERYAPPAFQKVFQVASTDTSRLLQPLLVQDLNGDGRSEIILAGRNLVFWNRGSGQFESTPFLSNDHAFADAAILADFTGDGHLDFVAVDTSLYPLLFEGDSSGQFTTPGRRLADAQFEQPKVFTASDIDGDGDLDLFIANYKNSYDDGQMASPYYDANDGHPAYLFRNEGDGTFIDVTEAAGLSAKRFRRTYSSSFVDLDNDNDMDLIVVSDFAGLDLYLNDGTGQFTDVTEDLGRNRHLFGMSHTFGDYDLDGNLDLYVTGMGSTTARRLEGMGLGPEDKPEQNDLRSTMGYGNRMFVRQGNKFGVAAFNDQIAQSGWSWGTSSFDLDNDGDQDIFVANGHISGKSIQDYCTVFWRHDIYTDDSQENAGRDDMFQFVMSPLQETEISWNGYEHKVLWMNGGGTRFTNVAYLLGVAFEYDARAVVTDDLDGDGHVDLLVVEFKWETNDHTLHVYQNRLPEAGNWIGVRLREGGPGLSTIGATVTIVTETGSQFRRFVTGDSFSAQHSATAHFGLGAQTEVETIEVRWPNGTTRRIDRPAINQYFTVKPPLGTN
ncbi:MAG: CRTAC1 family protein [Acidobacteriota bacterium]|nr:CRTAC1 family protein [Acidobacteriota bacterium]